MKLMCIIFFASVVANTVAQVPHDKLGPKLLKIAQTHHDTCRDQSGTNEAQIQRLVNGHFDENEPIKEYVTCLLLSCKVLLPDGTLNMKVINDLVPPVVKDTAPSLYVNCFNKYEDEPSMVEKIYKMDKCVYTTDPKNFVMF